MRRMVWVSIGAVGGVLAYRKLEEIVNESVDKGIVLTVMDASASAKALAVGMGSQVTKIRGTSQQAN
jgi:hypothetical protein